jgi:hypothetical protein
MNKKLYLLTCYFTFAFLTPAYAYLDPGIFSIVLQSILAAVAGIVATYKLWLYKLKNLLNKIKSKYKTKNNNPKE